jgi:hypothetical protein
MAAYTGEAERERSIWADRETQILCGAEREERGRRRHEPHESRHGRGRDGGLTPSGVRPLPFQLIERNSNQQRRRCEDKQPIEPIPHRY